jgi:hypothetical protein
MKSLLKSGDTDKIIFFANVSRQREIYILVTNQSNFILVFLLMLKLIVNIRKLLTLFFINLDPGANVIKLFLSVIYEFS